MGNSSDSVVQRLLETLDLIDFGMNVHKQTLRRENPRLSSEEIEELFLNWLRSRPGAESGDCVGTPRLFVT